jgi:hypothetical protein
MPRKRWTAQTEVTPSLIKLREKRKWQIALRRYLLERNPCVGYAAYFGLDIESFRNWIEMQFTPELAWENFGTNWQFEHVVPVAYFDFENDHDLKLCWNFTNIRVERIDKSKEGGNRIDVLLAKEYFHRLYNETGYAVCGELLEKISSIETTERISSSSQAAFLRNHKEYLDHIEGFTSYEFELLNTGRDIEEVKKEAELIKKLGR